MSWLIRLLQEEGVGGNAPNLLLHLKGDGEVMGVYAFLNVTRGLVEETR